MVAQGGLGKRRTSNDKAATTTSTNNRRHKSLGVVKKSKPKSKSKAVSFKNQIRSIERMLRKDLPPEIREDQTQKLEELKKQQELHNRLAEERKNFLRNRKIKFFERRKIDRRIRRLEKQQGTSSSQAQEIEIAEQLAKLKEDLEYVKFFPKSEKYVSLFLGGDEQDMVEKRNKIREQIKANIVAAAASGKDLEETGCEDDGLLDPSDDDFFKSGSSSDDDDADDVWTDKSAREQASSASGKASSGLSSDERNQRQISALALKPQPRPSSKPFSHSVNKHSRFEGPTSKKSSFRDMSTSNNTSDSINKSVFRKERAADSLKPPPRPSSQPFSHLVNKHSRFEGPTSKKSSFRDMSTSSNTSDSIHKPAFRKERTADLLTHDSSNPSLNSDARKPKRKRRPKKKKQAV